MANNIIDLVGSHTFAYTTVTGNLPIVAGSLQVIGNTPMIPLDDATVAEKTVSCVVGAAVLIPKRAAAATTGGALVAGGRVYCFSATGEENKGTGLAAAGELIGYAIEAATTGATTVKVRLIDGPSPLETQT